MLVSVTMIRLYRVLTYFFAILGADSLEYLSLPGLIKAVRSDIKTKNNSKVGHCTACLNGVYPGGDPVKNPDLDW